MPALRLLSGILLVSMGCYLSNWWRGLLWLEQLGQHIWRRVQPLTRSLLPVRRWYQALLIGLCWGLLPCGLIYTALAWSAAAGSASGAASLMFCFGLGTVPVMFATGAAGQGVARILRHRGLRVGASVLLIGFGLYTMLAALQPMHGGHAGASAHQHHSQGAVP